MTNKFTTHQVSEETDFEMSAPVVGAKPNRQRDLMMFFAGGILFGMLLVKSEVISWFRIQEMFRLQSFHMYGVIGSAIATGALSVWLIRTFNIKTIHGDPIKIEKKPFHKGNIAGGFLFGCGWALTGACPGPLFAQIGTGALVVTVTLFSALAGTWVYGYFRPKLPH